MSGWRRWQSPVLFAVVIFVLSLAFAIRASLTATGGTFVYAVDDAYIHMALAKNLARHGLWGCTQFHFSASSSSLLWPVLLMLADLIVGVRDLTPLVLNIGLAVLTLVAADHYLKRFGAAPMLRTAALLGVVLGFPLPGMVLLGMEHILHLFLTIWFAGAAVEFLVESAGNTAPSRKQTWRLFVLGALLGASRYEGFFLVGLVCLGLFARREWWRGSGLAGAAMLPAVVFGIISISNGGLFFPNSLMLKAGGDSASFLSILSKSWSPDSQILVGDNPLSNLTFLALAVALPLGSLSRTAWRPHVIVPSLLALMIVLHVHFAFSSAFWVYRYDAYLIAFGIFAAAVVLASPEIALFAPFTRGGGWVLALLLGALVVAVADVGNGLVPDQEVAGMVNTFREHFVLAEFVKRYYPRATVVVNDLGAVSYLTDDRILDMVGLGDMEPLTIRRRTGADERADVASWTARYRPTLAIVQLSWVWVAQRIPNDWIKVAEIEIPSASAKIGIFAMNPGDVNAARENVRQFFGPIAYPLHVF